MSEPRDAVLADGTPERLGRYRLVRPISTGGMARVFEARRESMHGVAPKVAVKVILPDYAKDPNFQQLFVNEARLGSLLQHQNLVQIQDFDCQQDLYYLVMEYVDGPTLRRSLSLAKRNGLAVPVGVVAEIGRQVCEGLDYAHRAVSDDGQQLRLVHRDIKPSNLILTPQGTVKVLDFGISKALISYERQGAIRGTWGYMAPEQAGGLDVQPAADLFGLSAVLYETVSQRPLFPEKDPKVIRQLLADDEAARRAAAIGGPYSPLAPILVRGLQRDPAARYSSAAAMAKALAGIAVDPVGAREALMHFQASVVGIDSGVLPAADQGGLVSSLNAHGPAAGLPVAVGDHHGPRDISIGGKAPVQPKKQAQGTGGFWTAMFLVVAIGVVAFTAWSLFGSRAPSSLETSGGDGANAERTSVGGGTSSTDPAIVAPVAPAPAPAPPATVVPESSKSEKAESVTPKTAEPRSAAPVTPASPRAETPESLPAAAATPSPAVDAAPVVDPVRPTVSRKTPVGVGSLTVSAIPQGVRINVDGVFVRISPMFNQKVEAGERTVTLIASDGREKTFTVDVPDGGQVRRVWSFDEGRFVGQ